MKTKKTLWGILCLILVFGLFFAGCDTPTGGSNSGNGNGNGSENENGNENGNGNGSENGNGADGGGGPAVPNAPAGVSATAQSSSSVLVSWNSVSGAASYKVYYSNTSSGTYTLDGTSSSTSYTSTDWVSGTAYFKVTAVNSAGESAYSSVASATLLSGDGGGGGTAVPSAPTGVSATAQSSSSVLVSWNSVSGAASYKVYYSLTSSGTYNLDGTSNSISYTSTGWSDASIAFFKVTAVNSTGESNYSSVASATLPSGGGAAAPGAPTGVSAATQSSSSVLVTWNSVSGAANYRVYYSKTYSGTYTFDGTSSSTSYTSTGWDYSGTVYFKVTAVNSAGEGNYSSAASVILSSGSGNGGTSPSYGSVRIQNNSSHTIKNLTIYRVPSGIDLLTATIPAASEQTVNNVMLGTYDEIGSETHAGYKVRTEKTFTVISGQTVTLTITNSDLITN
jgi:fibronectin type 3 domain-containing protein